MQVLPGDQIMLIVSALLHIYLGFYVTFNNVQVMSRRVVLWAEETSTYKVGQGSVPSVSNYQLSHVRSGI